MASDNQVSSILLLILIGLAIYFLLNPEGFTGKSQTENFDDLETDITGNADDLNYEDVLPNDQIQSNDYESMRSLPVPELPQPNFVPQQSEPVMQQSAPVMQQSVPIMQQSAPVVYEPVPVVQMQNNVLPIPSSLPVPVLPALDSSEPIVSQSVLSEIINEAPVQKPVPTLFEPKKDVPVVQKPEPIQSQPAASQMVYNPNVQLTANDIASVANFDPNDEDYDYGATDLTTAFMPPLPPGAKPDMVDFKKNNVDKYNAKDFLPKQVNDEWFETDFSLAKYQLNDDKLINTEKYIIGINTVGESLKNASYDIRGTIPNPKFIVSPWNNSTYEPDFNLKPLC
jgi:hypothetical protein